MRSLTCAVQEVHEQAHDRDAHVDNRRLCVVALQAPALQPAQTALLSVKQDQV